jgi:hypothetical protein
MTRIVGPEHRIVQALTASATLATPNTFKATFIRIAPLFGVEQKYVDDVISGHDRYVATGSFANGHSTEEDEDLPPDPGMPVSEQELVELTGEAQSTTKVLDPYRSKQQAYLSRFTPEQLMNCKSKGCLFTVDSVRCAAFITWRFDFEDKSASWNCSGTTDRAKHLREATDSLVCIDGRPVVFVQEWPDVIITGKTGKLTTWVYAVKHVPGQEFRFWRQKDGSDDLKWKVSLP